MKVMIIIYTSSTRRKIVSSLKSNYGSLLVDELFKVLKTSKRLALAKTFIITIRTYIVMSIVMPYQGQ